MCYQIRIMWKDEKLNLTFTVYKLFGMFHLCTRQQPMYLGFLFVCVCWGGGHGGMTQQYRVGRVIHRFVVND